MFRRILVVLDDSEAARSAFVFATDWVRRLDAEVWFIVLTDETSRRKCEVVSDVRHCGRLPSNSFAISGATRRARNVQLASGIAKAARAYRADLIVLGLDPRRMTRQRFTKGVRELLAEATDLPMLIAPQKTKPAGVPTSRRAQTQSLAPIALEPVRQPAMAELVLATV
jgi:nucleotide-binding universal stress UspA family protein